MHAGGGRGRRGGRGGKRRPGPAGEEAPQYGGAGKDAPRDSREDSHTDYDEEQMELAQRLKDMMSAELSQRTALTKRVGELEVALASARKELADLRGRNEQLAEQLRAAGKQE